MTDKKTDSTSPAAPTAQTLSLLSVQEAEREIQQGTPTYDVRWQHRRDEDGEIPGVKGIDRNAVVQALAHHDRNDRVLLVCNSDAGSAEIGRTLLAAGFKDVVHVEGGFQEWKRLGKDVQKKTI